MRLKLSILSNQRLLISMIVVLLIVLLAAWGWHQLHSPKTMPIKIVKVTGHYPSTDKALIEKNLQPLVQQGLFSINIARLKARLEQMPWTKSVVVKRVWPDKLWVQLTQKKAIAVWDDNRLLSAKAKIFQPDKQSFPPDLPQFYAVDNKAQALTDAYHKFSHILSTIHLHIAQLRLTSGMLWSVQLSNGMEVMIGDNHMVARLQRFTEVYSKIFTRKTAKYVDLRYANGVAVKWT
jgi:cell division protein FtsQ